ncbi:hypothetical protein PIIN_11612 [Serendipita indica DSM 11827]|uniref:Uncharacterized protein n=1 Tax=Serendipita indica (strain DSM 11827) TaxID=1109443 RepID=G4U241_SERID|nr:hypothetical protein PIIN_11612 [Serendipita indica DSM 11827]
MQAPTRSLPEDGHGKRPEPVSTDGHSQVRVIRGTTFASEHTDTPPRSMSRSKIEDLGFLELVPGIDPIVE